MVLTLLFLTLLLPFTLVYARPTSIWHVDIFKGPAPPPDQGPPLSATALRNPSKLKYEIVGIIFAYVIWTLVTVVLIVFVGGRLRRKSQTSNRTLSMEMLKLQSTQAAPAVQLGPLSPSRSSFKSWINPRRGHGYKDSNISVSTVDEKVIEADRARNLDEMAKLYAAVMEHDEEISQKARSSVQSSPIIPRSPRTPKSPRSPFYPQESHFCPPELQHLRDVVASPDHPLIHPLAPTPTDEQPEATASRANGRKVRVSPLPLGSMSHSRTGSGSSKNRPSRISIRDLPISPPLGSADMRESSRNSDEKPLSPKLYNPGPPPPIPEQKSAAATAREMGRKPAPSALSLRSAAATNSSNSLPFRQVYAGSMKSAPPTKTTFVERRESVLGIAPKTGIPRTPYSPYMPFTPMTPVTPRRLVTKDEMKQNKKKEGLKVVSEDDMVRSDEDMWGAVN